MYKACRSSQQKGFKPTGRTRGGGGGLAGGCAGEGRVDVGVGLVSGFLFLFCS